MLVVSVFLDPKKVIVKIDAGIDRYDDLRAGRIDEALAPPGAEPPVGVPAGGPEVATSNVPGSVGVAAGGVSLPALDESGPALVPPELKMSKMSFPEEDIDL